MAPCHEAAVVDDRRLGQAGRARGVHVERAILDGDATAFERRERRA